MDKEEILKELGILGVKYYWDWDGNPAPLEDFVLGMIRQECQKVDATWKERIARALPKEKPSLGEIKGAYPGDPPTAMTQENSYWNMRGISYGYNEALQDLKKRMRIE